MAVKQCSRQAVNTAALTRSLKSGGGAIVVNEVTHTLVEKENAVFENEAPIAGQSVCVFLVKPNKGAVYIQN